MKTTQKYKIKGVSQNDSKTVNTVKAISAVYYTCSHTMWVSKSPSKNSKCSMNRKYKDYSNNIIS